MEMNKITHLIFLYYTNRISEDERKELQEWLDADPHHQELMKRMLDAEDFSRRHAVSELFDENKAWYRFKKNVINQEKSRKGKSFRLFYYYISAAVLAAALFLIGETYWFSSLSKEELLSVSSPEAQIFPSDDGVIISYDNERKVVQSKELSLADSIVYMTKIENVAIVNYTVEVPKGNTFTLKLEDGSCIYLNSGSKIRLPKKFPGNIREVNLCYGEAYFDVARDTLRPFIVNTGNQRVSVLGTSFAIRAYEDEPEMLTTLVSGKVRVKSGDFENTLTPGLQSVCSNNGIKVRKVDVSLYTAWQKGVLVFKNESLGSIMETLARWYNLDVSYESERLKNIHFTGELKRYQAVNEFLEKIEYLKKVRFQIKERTILVSTYN